jgi:hypothetical protein
VLWSAILVGSEVQPKRKAVRLIKPINILRIENSLNGINKVKVSHKIYDLDQFVLDALIFLKYKGNLSENR